MKVNSLAVVQQSINANFLALTKRDRLCDVRFEVGLSYGHEETICGIRALFAIQSKPLEAMLFGPMIESNKSTIIQIPDIKPNTFRWLRKYCYNLNPTITFDNVVDILYISENI